MPALTEEQKQARRERAEERKARRREQWERELADRQTAAAAMRSILKNPNSSPDQLIFALTALDNLEYYSLVPSSLKTGTVDLSAIRERLNIKTNE